MRYVLHFFDWLNGFSKLQSKSRKKILTFPDDMPRVHEKRCRTKNPWLAKMWKDMPLFYLENLQNQKQIYYRIYYGKICYHFHVSRTNINIPNGLLSYHLQCRNLCTLFFSHSFNLTTHKMKRGISFFFKSEGLWLLRVCDRWQSYILYILLLSSWC